MHCTHAHDTYMYIHPPNMHIIHTYMYKPLYVVIIVLKSYASLLCPQDRAGTNSPLDFEVVGGSEYGSEIFVASVKTESMPEAAGLLVGDQVSLLGEDGEQ